MLPAVTLSWSGAHLDRDEFVGVGSSGVVQNTAIQFISDCAPAERAVGEGEVEQERRVC